MADKEDFQIKIESYMSAIEMLAKMDQSEENQSDTTPINEKDALSVLVARDELEHLITQNIRLSVTEILTIADLDHKLAKYHTILLNSINVAQFHDLLHPPKNHWWWFVPADESLEEQIDPWDRFDWVFNLLSMAFLAGFASLATQVIPIVFSNGLSILESVGFLGPGAVLTMIGSNLRGGEGRDKFIKAMGNLGVPAKFCSEVTCLLALILFSAAYVARQSLPKYYFQSLFDEGVSLYKQSRLIRAQESLNAALKLPDSDPKQLSEVFNYLGLIEESTGQYSKAIEYYDRSILLDNKEAISNISRVYIAKEDLLTAETYLKLGIQRTSDTNDTKDKILQFNLRRNLGRVYLEGKRYKEAEVELETARTIRSQYLDKEQFFGKGMASCFLAVVYEKTDRYAESVPIWQECREISKPETLDEYRAIVKFKPEIAIYINTQGIF
ncbi:MAG: tetratricopeptide repeat protein [Pseudanabaenaceae cyanobacterium]|jgi:tetratricopeptide (TPR) repeat protein